MSDNRYRLIQGGIPVAGVEGSGAVREILHYAWVYRQDGPVEIEKYQKGKWRRVQKLP